MDALVTDAHSVLGRHVVDRLLARGDRVRVLALDGEARGLPRRRQLEVVHGSVVDAGLVADAAAPAEVVYHLAQVEPGGGSAENLVETNVTGTEHVVRACLAGHARLVHLSTVMVYQPTPWPALWPITEGSPRRAHGDASLRNYGQTKIDAENRILQRRRGDGLEYVILRPTLVYGAGVPFAEQFVRQVVARPAAAIARYAVFGTMQWVEVRDLAKAVLLAGTRPEAANTVLNIAGREAFVAFEAAGLVWRLLAGDPRRFTGPSRPGLGGSRLKFDIRRAQALLGYSPKETLRTGLEDVLDAIEVGR
jgi:nucleoside-diphosphate-sugar epimerase